LAISVTILVNDQDNVVFSDFGNNTCLLIGLDQAIDLWKICGDSILDFSSESFVISDCPFHVSSTERCKFTVRPKNLTIKVVEMSHDDSVFNVKSINFSFWFWVNQRTIFDLNDISIWHVTNNQTIFQCQGSARTFSWKKVIVIE
jgi:hypothetical protein